MNFWVQVQQLIKKDWLLELRSKYAINGILLYVVSTIFVCYQVFQSLDPKTWNALYWIIMLFAAINASSKSFTQENHARNQYYYTLVSARAVILAKIIYNIILMLALAILAFLVYSTIFSSPVQDVFLFFSAVVLGGMSFATVFTMVSGISAKAGNNVTLMSILSFPIIIPLLIVLIKLSSNAMDGLARSESIPELFVLIAINVISITISLLLFPYLWRE